jgi:hypothetical protein
MSFTMTRTATESFTLTHAKYLASKVTADMVRCQQHYGRPGYASINDFGTELALLLRDGYVATYEFGFERNDQRLVSWHYTVSGSNITATDDRPGRIVIGVDVTGAAFFNYLTRSQTWWSKSQPERDRIDQEMPFQRTTGTPPSDGLGSWQQDLYYSSTGVTLGRKTFKPLLS